jgi:hypothetical protein
MDALPIVVALDVSEQVASGLVPGSPSSLMDELDLERVEEALQRSIIAAASRAAHGRPSPPCRRVASGRPPPRTGCRDPRGRSTRRPAAALQQGDHFAFALRCELSSRLRHSTPSPLRMSVSEATAMPRQDRDVDRPLATGPSVCDRTRSPRPRTLLAESGRVSLPGDDGMAERTALAG